MTKWAIWLLIRLLTTHIRQLSFRSLYYSTERRISRFDPRLCSYFDVKLAEWERELGVINSAIPLTFWLLFLSAENFFAASETHWTTRSSSLRHENCRRGHNSCLELYYRNERWWNRENVIEKERYEWFGDWTFKVLVFHKKSSEKRNESISENLLKQMESW